jgi:hypothetical protein
LAETPRGSAEEPPRLTGKAEVFISNRVEDFEIPVWVLPGLGYVAQNFIEGI